MKKIDSGRMKYSGMEPVSIYHVEYEPRLIIRSTTSYAKNELMNLLKLLVIRMI